jgi:general secretion pathway protein L
MPVDRELVLPSPSERIRDFARRLGVTGFWAWWTKELSALVPARPRAAMQRRRMRPVFAFDGERATLWLPSLKGARITMVETASIELSGDPAVVAAEGRAALTKRSGQAAAVPMLGPKLVVSLAPRATLRKMLVLPAAVENDLRQALSYDLDRHTPFKPDEVYFDAVVVHRDTVRGQIQVEMVAARRTLVDAAVNRAQSFGATVVAVVPEPPSSASTSRLNLLPAELRQNGAWWKRWQFWLPIGLLAAAALIAVTLPVWQKRDYVIALNDVAARAFQQAAVSESVRAQLERQVGDYNFALERKYAYPSTVQILDDVTRLLPDDTWLTQLEIKTNGRGKETQHELMLRGESANAGRLVTLLEDSRLFTQAAPRSPTTKIQPGPGEIFDLGAQLKPLPQPTAVLLAATEKPVIPTPSAIAPAATPAVATSEAASAPKAGGANPAQPAKTEAVPAASSASPAPGEKT